MPTKSKRLEVRVTDAEMSELKQLADRHGVTVSAYVVRRLLTPDPNDVNGLQTRHRPSPKKAELYRAVSRANLLLDEIRQHLVETGGDLSRPMLRAVLLALLAIDEKLEETLTI